jgi:hypothetical protein
MTSIVTIYNMALSHLGTRQTVLSVDEPSVEAATLGIHYTTARDATLRGFDWSFARRIEALAPIGIEVPPGYSRAYGTPNLCARFRGIWTGGRGEKPVPFRIVNHATAGGDATAILTDRPEAVGWYTKIVTDPELFDPLFVSALSWRLAAEAALALTQKADLLLKCEQKAQLALAAATVEDAGEDMPVTTGYTPEILAVRGYETSGEGA